MGYNYIITSTVTQSYPINQSVYQSLSIYLVYFYCTRNIFKWSLWFSISYEGCCYNVTKHSTATCWWFSVQRRMLSLFQSMGLRRYWAQPSRDIAGRRRPTCPRKAQRIPPACRQRIRPRDRPALPCWKSNRSPRKRSKKPEELLSHCDRQRTG